MTAQHRYSQTVSRGCRMLRTALGSAIAGYLDDARVIEVILNPDGRFCIERLSEGLCPTDHCVSHAGAPRVSAELPETGERFEGLLPPVVAAPTFAIRKPAGTALGAPRVSAELPETGERFEGLLPPVVAAPNFAIRKPAGTALGALRRIEQLIQEAARLELSKRFNFCSGTQRSTALYDNLASNLKMHWA